MVNPGLFKGKRMGEKSAYAAGVEGGYAADAIAVIQRRYFKRFPIDLPHDQDPTQEQLDAVNDEEAEPEPDIPREDRLSPEEHEAKVRRLQRRSDDLDFRKGQIKCWLVYQYMKDQSPGDTSKDGPYHALLYKLTGTGSVRPRQKTASNVWRRDQRDVIEEEAKRRIEAGGIKKSKLASVRQSVATEIFAALSEDQKGYWEQQASNEHDEAVKQWERKLKGPPSTAPRDRQKCILGLTEFMQPILDGICAATGWKCMFFAGGPEPAHSGRLNVIAVHSGTTKGDVKMNFGRAERQQYKDSVLPVIGSFLRKCYSPEDCHAFALPPSDKVKAVQVESVEKDGGSLDTIPDESASGSVSKSRLPNTSNSPHPAGTTLTPPPAVATVPTPIPQAVHPTASNDTSQTRTTQAAVTPSSYDNLSRTTTSSDSHTALHNMSPPSCTIDAPPSAKSTASNPSGLENPLPISTQDVYAQDFPTTPFEHAPSPPLFPCPSRGGSPPSLSPRRDHKSTPMPSSLSTTDLSPPQIPVPATAGMSASSSGFNTVAAVVASAIAECPFPAPQGVDVPSTSSIIAPAPILPSCLSSHTIPDITDELSPPSATSERIPPTEPLQLSTTMLSTFPLSNNTPPPPPTVSAVHENPVTQPSQPQMAHAIISSITTPIVHGNQLRRPPPPERKRQTTSKENGGPPAAAEPNAKRLRPDKNAGTTLRRPPLWFSKAASQFSKEDLGNQWILFVSLWQKFEEREGYADSSQLPTFNPPPEIEAWMKHPRLANWRPVIEAQEFAKEFAAWWTSLQPEWRVAQGEVKQDRLDGDWGTLRRPGRHGFASVVGALFLWGLAARESECLCGVWLSVLEDCNAALEHL